ncbi:hypothetical protein EGR_02849 [Echinococcus granulosus]|uniref:Uncharacterized protein n=1 Tax=Echinococcus granulosus TaxID=6210 RepID=W6UMN8_ECHGR|nr:hypothetical protein EGR_02849 [Echinococcus granulosus]EUB62396.1 hypothetical protein EGR_02849 [Echinococcus granulosus]
MISISSLASCPPNKEISIVAIKATNIGQFSHFLITEVNKVIEFRLLVEGRRRSKCERQDGLLWHKSQGHEIDKLLRFMQDPSPWNLKQLLQKLFSTYRLFESEQLINGRLMTFKFTHKYIQLRKKEAKHYCIDLFSLLNYLASQMTKCGLKWQTQSKKVVICLSLQVQKRRQLILCEGMIKLNYFENGNKNANRNDLKIQLSFNLKKVS